MKEINILTIGQISYVDSQKYFINQFRGVNNVFLLYSGLGPAVPYLVDYVKRNAISNVFFSGRYEKKDEARIVETADIINIWLKSGINSDSCMANRFYLSALLRKPMIVCHGSYMAELCKEYDLGIILKEGEDFAHKIREWYLALDYDSFSERCRLFLNMVRKEMHIFENNLVKLYY